MAFIPILLRECPGPASSVPSALPSSFWRFVRNGHAYRPARQAIFTAAQPRYGFASRQGADIDGNAGGLLGSPCDQTPFYAACGAIGEFYDYVGQPGS